MKCPDCGADYAPDSGSSAHANCPGGGTLAPPPADIATLHASAEHFASTPSPRPPSTKITGGTPTPSPGGSPRPGSRQLPAEVTTAMELPSRHIGSYILVAKVGKGGMGEVWKAWDKKLARTVAIKFLLANDETDVLRFEREAQLAAGLRHPNIAPIYEFGQHEERHFLVMEFIDGASLDKAALAEKELVTAMIQVGEAVDYANASGVIHRDLKPQNIMLTAKGWPFVMDFGLAKQVEGGSELSVSGMVVGTPSYMPPEQARGATGEIDRRSDVYSLGATFYSLLTGQAPFKAQNPMDVLMKVMKDDPEPPRKIKPSIPAELEIITLKAMEKDSSRRYQTAGEFAADLKRWQAGDSILARPPSLGFLVARSIRRNAWRYASVGLALVALAAVGIAVVAARRTNDPLANARAEAWVRQLRELRAPLTLDGFNPAGAAPLNAHLRHADATPTGLREAAAWFRDQAAPAKALVDAWSSDRATWVDRRTEADRIVRWIASLRESMKGLGPDFDAASSAFDPILALSQRIASFLGQVTLRFNVRPWARIESMKAGGTAVVRDGAWLLADRGRPSESDLRTPLAVTSLEIDDYVIVLSHPKLGSCALTIAANSLKHGGEYFVTGDLEGAGSIQLRPKP